MTDAATTPPPPIIAPACSSASPEPLSQTTSSHRGSSSFSSPSSAVVLPASAAVPPPSTFRSGTRSGISASVVAPSRNPYREYEFQEVLGEGAYGTVWRAVHRATGDSVAVKIVSVSTEDDDTVSQIGKEVENLRECRHPNICQLRESFTVRKNGDASSSAGGIELHIVMEFCAGGSCADLMDRLQRPFSESQIHSVIDDALHGIRYLHELKKIHRDVKAGNILLTSRGVAKLGDFGVAGQLSSTLSQRRTVIGSPFWMAPEVIDEVGYTTKVDVWSLGITCVELAQGRPPHYDVHPMRAIFLIASSQPPTLREPSAWSPEFAHFVSRCLVKDSSQRASADELLRHPWIVGGSSAASTSEEVSPKQQRDRSCILKLLEEAKAPRSRQSEVGNSPQSSLASKTMGGASAASPARPRTPPRSSAVTLRSAPSPKSPRTPVVVDSAVVVQPPPKQIGQAVVVMPAASSRSPCLSEVDETSPDASASFDSEQENGDPAEYESTDTMKFIPPSAGGGGPKLPASPRAPSCRRALNSVAASLDRGRSNSSVEPPGAVSRGEELLSLRSDLDTLETQLQVLKRERGTLNETVEKQYQVIALLEEENVRLKAMVGDSNRERDEFRHKAFVASALSLKLQATLQGWATSGGITVTTEDLWERSQSERIPENLWEEWICRHM